MKKERFFKYTGKNANNHMISYFTVNRLYKLIRLDGDENIVVIDDEGDVYNAKSVSFEEVTEEPINLNKKLDELEAAIAQVKKNIEERDTYKEGDIVVLVSERPNTWNFMGRMDEFLGRVVKLTYIEKTSINFYGSKRWAFSLSDIERKATTEEINVFENTKLPNIGGYEGEDRGTSIAYGCKSMQKNTLLRMQGDGVDSFTVQGSPVTREEFARITYYIKKTNYINYIKKQVK